jgi:hypothetical protein
MPFFDAPGTWVPDEVGATSTARNPPASGQFHQYGNSVSSLTWPPSGSNTIPFSHLSGP